LRRIEHSSERRWTDDQQSSVRESSRLAQSLDWRRQRTPANPGVRSAETLSWHARRDESQRDHLQAMANSTQICVRHSGGRLRLNRQAGGHIPVLIVMGHCRYVVPFFLQCRAPRPRVPDTPYNVLSDCLARYFDLGAFVNMPPFVGNLHTNSKWVYKCSAYVCTCVVDKQCLARDDTTMVRLYHSTAC
jgi:hypothetical protein